MKLVHIFGYILSACLILMLLGAGYYVYLFYPRPTEPFEINSPIQAQRILLVRQGSTFKSALIVELCDSLRQSPVYIKGIDVKDLAFVKAGDWDKILIITTFMAQLNRKIEQFISRNTNLDNILLLVTSGGDDWQPQPDLKVDAITSASRMHNIDQLVQMIAEWANTENGNWVPADYLLAIKYFPLVDISNACASIAQWSAHYRMLYPNLINELNLTGYYHLRLKNIDAAINIFKLNVSLFPDSWNVYDSLGEALVFQGNHQAAIINYRRALKINPTSQSAKKALEKLGDI